MFLLDGKKRDGTALRCGLHLKGETNPSDLICHPRSLRINWRFWLESLRSRLNLNPSPSFQDDIEEDCDVNSDDQGDVGFCSQFATAKVIKHGFLKNKFNKELYFNQVEITSAIINVDKVKPIKRGR